MVAVAVAVFGGRETMPRTARAAAPQPSAVSPETTQACQWVMDQITQIHRIVTSEQQDGQLTPMAEVDALVSQETSIDASKCPADFRMAEMRLIAAESMLSRDAHMDAGQKGEAAARQLCDIYAHQSRNIYKNQVADELKRDFDSIQAAGLDLDQVAMKYGVK
jgi:hypothetical protein